MTPKNHPPQNKLFLTNDEIKNEYETFVLRNTTYFVPRDDIVNLLDTSSGFNYALRKCGSDSGAKNDEVSVQIVAGQRVLKNLTKHAREEIERNAQGFRQAYSPVALRSPTTVIIGAEHVLEEIYYNDSENRRMALNGLEELTKE